MANPLQLISTAEKIVDEAGRATAGLVAKWQALVQPPAYTVASLPSSARVGQRAYATDLRVFNGTGTQEGPGAGTGGSVEWNGTAWKIVGTNVMAIA